MINKNLNRIFHYISCIFISSSIILISCSKAENQAAAFRLTQWDKVLEESPQAVIDSLKTLNTNKLSHANRAYHGLIKTIADDKILVHFTSDSLINSVQSYFHRHNPNSDKHIRSLVYLCIVRHRIGIADSTVFTPLKEAERLYLKQKQPDVNIGYMLYYYLGDIHSANNNYKEASGNFNRALQLAKQENDPEHIFDTYLSIYWNLLKQDSVTLAKYYLDTLQQHTYTPEQHYYFLNAQSGYLDFNKEHDLSLQKAKERIHLLSYLKEKPEYYKMYYSLSARFYKTNQLDSALHYGLEAIEHIKDSTNPLNYLLYNNIANIAAAQNNHKLADQYRDEALWMYEQSVKTQLNTRVLELEKRYNLSESENRALKAQRNSRTKLNISLITTLLLAYWSIHNYKQNTIGKLKVQEAFERNSRLQAEKNEAAERILRLQAEQQKMEEQANRQQRIVEVSAQFLSEYAMLQEKAREITNRIRVRDKKLGDDYEQILKDGQQHFNELADRLFTEKEFKEVSGVCNDLDVFSQSDRLFLIMLASNAPNTHIAAMLNTTTHNLKTRKAYLKEKIIKNSTQQNKFESLLPLFDRKKGQKHG